MDPALALALLNTSHPPGGGPDLWTAPDGVRAWLIEAGLAAESGPVSNLTPPESRILLDSALRLRRALGELVEAWAVPGTPPPGLALLELNRILEARPRRSLLLDAGPRGYRIVRRDADASVSGLLAPVADAAALLLSREDPTRVRRCAAPRCRRWFLDTSKNQRRRWCSMGVCGNRAKVAAHHRRRRRARA